MNKKVAVIVAGSWGTALASVLADNDIDVVLWSRREEQVKEINDHHTNEHFLPGAKLPERIVATTSLEDAVKDAVAVLLVVPSSGMREVTRKLQPYIKPDMLIIHATKGFEAESLKRMTQVISEELPQIDSKKIVVLSGPSHAEEVILHNPTTVVVASEDMNSAEDAQDLFINSYFRVYTNPDVIGVEVAGALKNIIALGAGLSDGLGFGDNAKAALMTRGIAEIARLGAEMGASPLTFAGLSGVGDLIVTCTSVHSRNWRAGSMLAKGLPLESVLHDMGMVVEGVKTTKAAATLAAEYNVTMPITTELYAVLFNNKPPKQAVEALMGRVRTNELEEVAQQDKTDWIH
ncbi:NAD(P)H-dependent glycerol-3-phosphate dehydrogenase [Paenibacillus albiflavus]|uniref:Glycerol-3-phosphate dehydrogenase [NAD(P)+] n=1 Tax=Paenibacillus albiflavus TaxID=2545760 RepID=A0A4R4EMY0_9BACL|nr:NAD(P)H-dependent glycerol-3-phosphate dehydrogenase [Paenibacillus albiflavus]TCZ81227.1 NAD(P)H-dependent glycerol-3-phosphate dehydrogenase [Paenibacillus albiflavus]